ncbi:LysR family transcriptional regulator [uncultured Desulfovibrio sp.]|uniref:LysR family transcriptional regulator n=1 Tax=uncultured Desulfovibrio sp. TaxID=167968 RepID=UPI0028053510|nr:LysR family transcriptional regulator [uncultured Desulfovibrio sp.]
MLQEFSGDFIQWLRGFYYTATCGNMTAAMKQMHRNQSALTYQIKCLEKEFGVKLFTGTKNNRILTEEGKLLLSRASQLFSFINELRQQLVNMPSDVHGELRIEAMFSFYNHILPQLVERFATRHSGVMFRLTSSLLESRLFEDVASNRVDMGILSSSRIPEEFMSIPLFLSELVLITPRGVQLDASHLSLEDLASLQLGAPTPKSSLWLNVSLQCQQYGITLKPKHIIDHQDCLLRCVASGLCCTILDRFVVDDIHQPGQFNIYPLKKFFRPRQYYVVMQKESPYQYPQVKAFFAFLMREFEVEDAERSGE